MSSRNKRLDPLIRTSAPIIYKTIAAASEMMTNYDITEIKTFVEESINMAPGFSIEYFEIVDDTYLIPVTKKSDMKKENRYFGCIAVMAGKIRLIDNIEIELV